MIEIKLKLDDPHSTIASLREGAGDLAPFGAKQVYEVVRQILEQIKPAVEEPGEFGSLIAATRNGERMRWQQAPDIGYHYWRSITGAVEVWSELTDVEVLRIGVGTERYVDSELDQQIAEALANRTERRFCTLDRNCCMADGHEGGCQP